LFISDPDFLPILGLDPGVKKASDPGSGSATLLTKLGRANSGLESLVQVSQDVLHILQSHAQPDQVLRDPERYALLLLNGGVGHQVGQLGQGLVSAQRLRQGDQLGGKID
jgi:hypothetical protein